MERIERTPPVRRIWMAVYIHLRAERFELRADEEDGQDYQVLWRGKAHLGSAAAELPDLDLNDLNRAADALGKEATADDLRMQARKLLDKSPYYLPAAAELLNIAEGRGKGTLLRVMRKTFNRYRQWQTTFKALAENVLSANANIDRPQRYVESCVGAHSELYPVLRYGKVCVEPVLGGSSPVNVWHFVPEHHFPVVEVLNTTDTDQFFCYLISKYLYAQLNMRPCKYCGRYFVLHGNSNQEYCDRPMEGSRYTCKEAGAMKLYVQRQNEDPAIRAYKRAYKTNYARIAYGLMTKEDFTAWSRQAREMRDKCVAGEISLEDFDAWLESGK